MYGADERDRDMMEAHFKHSMAAARYTAYTTMSAWTKINPSDIPKFPWEKTTDGQLSREEIIKVIKERKKAK